MKTVLFATTALVASAGIAAAEVTLSGSAEMGVFGSDNFDADPQFFTDIDVTFTLTGETDTGLTFGADVDLDETDPNCEAQSPFVPGSPAVLTTCRQSNAFNPEEQGGETIFISGAFGTLTMGDTDGAVDWALQEAIIGSAIADDHEHAGVDYVTGKNAALDQIYDGQIARYEYAFGDFSVAGSAMIDDSDEADPVLGLGARYAMSFGAVDASFGAGVQTISGFEGLGDDLGDALEGEEAEDNQTVFGVSADLNFEPGIRVIGNFSDYDDLGQHYAFAVGYTVDAFTVAANYGKFDGDTVGDAKGWGLVANYDLGGGAELQAGYGNNDIDGRDDFSTYSFGIAMSF